MILFMTSCKEQAKTDSIMEQRLSIITIGTDDLHAMRNFYVQTFGWQPVAENKEIIFFKLNGFLFGLCGRTQLAEFADTTPE
jgi:catechol 2,3-dioxygenase-like lactoylglutathione lyase family enzyme